MNAAKKTYCLLLLLIALSTSGLQADEYTTQLRRKRLNTIDLFHFGAGAEAAFFNNWTAGAKLFLGIGSEKHLLSGDIGIKYSVTAPLIVEDGELVLWQQMPLFLSLNVQPYRWKNGCMYVGTEVAYNILTTAIHSVAARNFWTSDQQLHHNHLSINALAGIKFNEWIIGLFYQYDLAPAINQKYVYESSSYDFDVLQESIYERMRVGISVSYIWNINP